MKLTAIFATTGSGAFGNKGDLPWARAAPDDLQHFKNATMGHAMIMGYNTYPGVKHLQGRDKIVVTSRPDQAAPSTHFVPTIEEAIKKAKLLGHTDAFIIGGAKLLESCAHLAHAVLWSRVQGEYHADVYLDVYAITGGRVLEGITYLADATKVYQYGEVAGSSLAISQALDKGIRGTFGGILIKDDIEYEDTQAKEDALEITKKMLR